MPIPFSYIKDERKEVELMITVFGDHTVLGACAGLTHIHGKSSPKGLRIALVIYDQKVENGEVAFQIKDAEKEYPNHVITAFRHIPADAWKDNSTQKEVVPTQK